VTAVERLLVQLKSLENAPDCSAEPDDYELVNDSSFAAATGADYCPSFRSGDETYPR